MLLYHFLDYISVKWKQEGVESNKYEICVAHFIHSIIHWCW